MKKGVKRGESQLASNHFLMCSPQFGSLRDVHGVIQRREEGGGRQVARRIKWGIKRRETDPASNQFPKCSPSSGTHRDSQSWVETRGRRQREGGDEGGRRQR